MSNKLGIIKQAVRKAARYAPPLYAARCSPAPTHTRLTPAAPSAPCAMNIHDRQAAARSGYDYGVVHINYVVNWTANQSGLVTLTFDHLTLKVVSESRVTWATSVPLCLPRPLCSRVRPDVRDRRQTDRRQTKASLNASAHYGRGHNKVVIYGNLPVIYHG